MGLRYYLSAGLLTFCQLAANGIPTDSGSILFTAPFGALAQLKYEGHSPEITETLVKKLSDEAEANAKKYCVSIFGEKYKFLSRTHKYDFGQSILTYTLATKYLCGIEVKSTAEIVPRLIQSIGLAQEPVGSLIVKAGAPAFQPMMEFISAAKANKETLVTALRIYGRLLEGEGQYLDELGLERAVEPQGTVPSQDELYSALLPILNGDDSKLVYEAAGAFARPAGGATFAKRLRAKLSEEKYGQLVYQISLRWNQKSSYSVEAEELQSLLRSMSDLVVNYGISALSRRGTSNEEFGKLNADLEKLADPNSPRRQPYVFEVYAQHPKVSAIPLLVKAIDPKLLADEKNGHTFLLQAMLALEKFSAFKVEGQKALPALQEIVDSKVNPTNHYLQEMAKRVIEVFKK